MQSVFKLALEMGTARVARELRVMSVTHAESNEPITKGDLDAILRSVTVLGWRQNTSNNKPVGELNKGFYPAIITPPRNLKTSDRAAVEEQEGHAQWQASPQPL